MNNLELRTYTGPIELRAGDETPPTLVSVAPPWGSLSVDLGGFREQFARGAFWVREGGKNLRLEDLDVISTFEHDGRMLLGRTASGTLRLEDTREGLRYAVQLPRARGDVAELVERGDVRGSSFEFRTVLDKWEETDDGMVRTVLEAELHQVGPVTNPAYPEPAVALRSLRSWREEGSTAGNLDLYRRRMQLLELTL